MMAGKAGHQNVSRGTERSDPSVSSTCSYIAKCIRRAKRGILWAPRLSGKDQHQSIGPDQAKAQAKPFLWWESRARRGNVEAPWIQTVGPFANNLRTPQLKLAHRRSQERHAFCPRLDQRDPGVRPGDGKRQPRKTATSADVHDGRSRRNQMGHGKAVHDMLANHLCHGSGASKIDASVPLHQEATETQNAPYHFGCERESPFLGECRQTCRFVVEHEASIGHLRWKVLTQEAGGPYGNGSRSAVLRRVISCMLTKCIQYYLVDCLERQRWRL